MAPRDAPASLSYQGGATTTLNYQGGATTTHNYQAGAATTALNHQNTATSSSHAARPAAPVPQTQPQGAKSPIKLQRFKRQSNDESPAAFGLGLKRFRMKH